MSFTQQSTSSQSSLAYSRLLVNGKRTVPNGRPGVSGNDGILDSWHFQKIPRRLTAAISQPLTQLSFPNHEKDKKQMGMRSWGLSLLSLRAVSASRWGPVQKDRRDSLGLKGKKEEHAVNSALPLSRPFPFSLLSSPQSTLSFFLNWWTGDKEKGQGIRKCLPVAEVSRLVVDANLQSTAWQLPNFSPWLLACWLTVQRQHHGLGKEILKD